jgi:hypothetical protein
MTAAAAAAATALYGAAMHTYDILLWPNTNLWRHNTLRRAPRYEWFDEKELVLFHSSLFSCLLQITFFDF